MAHVDLNCDLGELNGVAGFRIESQILRHITSANVACGAHAGDAARMHDVAVLCRELSVAFGAHPGYADRVHFGRRVLPMSPSEIRQMVSDQIGLALTIATSEGITLSHVKPHGALYNIAARDVAVAEAIVLAVRDARSDIRIFGLSGSMLIQLAGDHGLASVNEVFADRNYLRDGTLVPRDRPDSVLSEPAQITTRAVAMIRSKTAIAVDGVKVPIVPETICVHSDTANAIEIAKQLRSELQANQIEVRRN